MGTPAEPVKPASTFASRLPPLFWPALALIGGILGARLLPLPAWPLIAAACGCLAVWLGRGLWRGRLSTLWLALTLGLLGAGLLSLERGVPPPPDHVRFHADNQLRYLLADLVAAPQPMVGGIRLLLRARSLDGQPVSGLVRLSLPAPAQPPEVGSRLGLETRLRPVTSFANPGGFDYAAQLALDDIHVQAHAGKGSGLKALGPGEVDAFTLTVESWRQAMGRLFDALEPGPARGLMRGLVLGQLGELSGPPRDAFAVTGTAHLLAISGMNLAIVWGWAFLLMRYGLGIMPWLSLRLPALKLAAALALIPTAAYALVGGASTPTLRALVMAACLVLALLVNRPYSAAGGLVLAVIVICLIWPQSPLTLSFQLSFLAVAAIVWGVLPLTRRVQGHGLRGRVKAAVLGCLAMTLVIELLLLPLTAHHFHQIPWLTLPANLILVPLVGSLVQLMALVGVGLGLLWPVGGVWLLNLGMLPAQWSIELNLWLASLPGAVSHLAGPGTLTLGLFYSAVLAALAWRGPWRWALPGALALAALASGVGDARPAPPDGKLTAWVLDVGQGSSTVLRLPQGQVLVADAGGGYGELDFGQRVIAPFLWSQGLKRADILIGSHPHPDHVGGMPFLARWLDPREIWTNGRGEECGPYGKMLAQARQRGVAVLGPEGLAREMELGGARLRLVWPPVDGPPFKLTENDASLWLGVGLGETWLWLPGDAGPRVERAVLPLMPQGGRNVLLAPHHGGKGSCGPELLDKLKPQAVVVSCGCANRFGMPRADTMRRVAEAGARAWVTATQGSIKLVADGENWRVEPYLNPPRPCPLPEGAEVEGGLE